MIRPDHAPDDRDLALELDALWLEHVDREWSDPEPRPCKWCDSEGVIWMPSLGDDMATEPCPECNGLGVTEHGF